MHQVRSILEDTYQLASLKRQYLFCSLGKPGTSGQRHHRKSRILQSRSDRPNYIPRQKDSDPDPRCPLSSKRTPKWLFRQRLRHRSYNPLHESEIYTIGYGRKWYG